MDNLLVLDLFSGTGSATSAFEAAGHEVIKVEQNTKFDADLHADLMCVDADDLLELTGGRVPDFIWASPPCTSFSVASNHLHWSWHGTCYYCRVGVSLVKREWVHDAETYCKMPTPVDKTYKPKSATGRAGIALLRATLDLIYELDPRWWIIENPRGLMRKMPEVQGIPRVTITHCQYGDPRRMKPTDLFGVIPPRFVAKCCKQGDDCHDPVPNGAQNKGTFSLDKVERATLPPRLGEILCELIEAEVILHGR